MPDICSQGSNWLVQVGPLCRTGDKPLSKPMMVKFTEAYTHHWASLSYSTMSPHLFRLSLAAFLIDDPAPRCKYASTKFSRMHNQCIVDKALIYCTWQILDKPNRIVQICHNVLTQSFNYWVYWFFIGWLPSRWWVPGQRTVSIELWVD